jgi:hypothetical protein
MMFPTYQPSPTVYIERDNLDYAVSPCKWYEDITVARQQVYCRPPAMWLVIAAVGAGTLFAIARKR